MMVGDDIRDDVIGAQEAGLVGALVKTGKYREGDEKKCETKPDFIFDDLMQLARMIVGKE